MRLTKMRLTIMRLAKIHSQKGDSKKLFRKMRLTKMIDKDDSEK